MGHDKFSLITTKRAPVRASKQTIKTNKYGKKQINTKSKENLVPPVNGVGKLTAWLGLEGGGWGSRSALGRKNILCAKKLWIWQKKNVKKYEKNLAKSKQWWGKCDVPGASSCIHRSSEPRTRPESESDPISFKCNCQTALKLVNTNNTVYMMAFQCWFS